MLRVSGQGPVIGFVFPSSESTHILVIFLGKVGYAHLGSKQIGFVLHNWLIATKPLSMP